jgi:hypothetical protein
VVLSDGERTWTVLDVDHCVVEPAEQFLEYLRMLGRSPNTVKSYARALALWWEFLAVYELAWDAVMVEDLGRFLGWLRTGDSPALVSIERRQARFSEGTIALRLQAVCSFYRFQHLTGVDAASRLYERVFSGRHPYRPMLEHLERGRGQDRRVVRVTRRRPAAPPTLTPEQVRVILDGCARWDERKRDWDGSGEDVVGSLAVRRLVVALQERVREVLRVANGIVARVGLGWVGRSPGREAAEFAKTACGLDRCHDSPAGVVARTSHTAAVHYHPVALVTLCLMKNF